MSYLVIVTGFIDIVFQIVSMFFLFSLVPVPSPFPSHPVKEGLVLLTEFIIRFGLLTASGKMDKERQGQRGRKRRTCSGKLNLVHNVRSFAGVRRTQEKNPKKPYCYLSVIYCFITNHSKIY